MKLKQKWPKILTSEACDTSLYITKHI